MTVRKYVQQGQVCMPHICRIALPLCLQITKSFLMTALWVSAVLLDHKSFEFEVWVTLN